MATWKIIMCVVWGAIILYTIYRLIKILFNSKK